MASITIESSVLIISIISDVDLLSMSSVLEFLCSVMSFERSFIKSVLQDKVN